MKIFTKSQRAFLDNVDKNIISSLREVSGPISRSALFTVFVWFGFLKIVGTSPANPLVSSLLEATMPFITFEQFIFVFALYEVLIGITFLIRGWERLAIALLIPHMFMTFLPLVLLPSVSWQGFMTPTLEGQYIIKNFVIIALAVGIASHLHPLKMSKTK